MLGEKIMLVELGECQPCILKANLNISEHRAMSNKTRDNK